MKSHKFQVSGGANTPKYLTKNIRKVAMATKTDKILRLLLELTKAHGNRISKEHAMQVLGVKKTGYHKAIEPLCEDNEMRPALLQKITLEDGIYFKLNTKAWSSFTDAGLEGRFFLESYKHIGHLLGCDYDNFSIANDDVYPKDLRDLKKKFLYLSKIQARPFSKKQQGILDAIIKALIGNNYLYINPEGDPVARRLMPLTLCQYRDDLYLICKKEDLDSGKWIDRTYKICRLDRAEVATDKFDYPAKWNPEEEYKYTSGIFRGDTKTCDIRVYDVVRRTFRERNFFGSKLISSTDTYDEYELKYTQLDEFLGQLFTYADYIEVLTPEVREKFVEKATAALVRQKESKKGVA